MRRLYEPDQYYQRIRTFLDEYKEPKDKAPVTLEGLVAIGRCLFWLGLVRAGRGRFWRALLWTCLYKRDSVLNFLVLAMIGYHFRKVSEELLGTASAAPTRLKPFQPTATVEPAQNLS